MNQTLHHTSWREILPRIWWIFRKEQSSFIGSNFPPLSIGIVAFVCGMISVLPHKSENTLSDITSILFHMFYIVILVSAVFLAMSSFVNERKQKTMELLYTLPVTDTQLVLGKFLMGVLLMGSITLGMTLVYLLWLAETPLYMALSGGMALFLVGLYAYSVGIFASSLSDSYLLSLLIGTLIIALIDIGGFLAGLLPSPAKEILAYFHGLNHFIPFTKGVISLKGITFFVSLTVLFLFSSVKVLESRRWKGSGS